MTLACPSCSGFGRLPDKASVNGMLRCPLCSGRGSILPSLPVPDEPKIVSSDLGMTSRKYWTPMSATGSLYGLPVSGKAVATDGVIVVLQLDNGQQFLGHLGNFVKDKQKSNREKSEKVDVNEGKFD